MACFAFEQALADKRSSSGVITGPGASMVEIKAFDKLRYLFILQLQELQPSLLFEYELCFSVEAVLHAE